MMKLTCGVIGLGRRDEIQQQKVKVPLYMLTCYIISASFLIRSVGLHLSPAEGGRLIKVQLY